MPIRNFTLQVRLSPSPCTVLQGWAGAVQEGSILQHRKHGTSGVHLISRYGFLLLLVMSYTAGLAPCKKALFFNTGSMERWGSFDLQVFTFQVQLYNTCLHIFVKDDQVGFKTGMGIPKPDSSCSTHTHDSIFKQFRKIWFKSFK